MNITVKIGSSDDEIDAAIARAQFYDEQRPKAVQVEYIEKKDVLTITFRSGVVLVLPRKLLQGLQDASAEDVAAVKLDIHGRGLHWDSLNVDHYIPGLLEGLFGSRKWMASIGAQGGSVKTKRKSDSSRANGRKGGRPRKDTSSPNKAA